MTPNGSSPEKLADVARFATIGVPAVNFGPGENAQAHQKNESTDLSLLFGCYRILHTWLTQMTPR